MNPLRLLVLLVTLPLLLGGCGEKVEVEPVAENKPEEIKKEEQVVDREMTVNREGITYILASDIPYTGKIIGLYSNGTIMNEFRYKDGKKHGTFVVYASPSNRQKVNEGIFKNGEFVSEKLWSWHKNGQKKSEVNYKGREKISVKYWNSKGEREPVEEAKAELLAAVKKGDLAAVKQRLANGADVNAKLSSLDETALHLAAGGGHKEIVELLIAAGADVNRQSAMPTNDGSRRTPLDNARSKMYGFGQVTPSMNLPKEHRHHKFKAIADVLKKNGGHSGSIFVAAKSGDIVGVKALMNGKVNLKKTGLDGRTPLHLAAENGHKEIASLFLDKGAQADFGNWSDKTALHYAAEKGHIEIIELLLSKGANVNALGGAQTGTPLDFATRFKRNKAADLKAADLLRKHGGKTAKELKDKRGEAEVILPDIEPADLIAERDWTDIQGRTLTASLIDALKRPDGSYYGKFRKADDSEFEYDIVKLSKPDRAFIKKALLDKGRIID